MFSSKQMKTLVIVCLLTTGITNLNARSPKFVLKKVNALLSSMNGEYNPKKSSYIISKNEKIRSFTGYKLKFIDPLGGFPNLYTVSVTGPGELNAVLDLSVLTKMRLLRSLHLTNYKDFTIGTEQCSRLTFNKLSISNCDIQEIPAMHNVKHLSIKNCDKLQNLKSLSGWDSIESIQIAGGVITSLDGLEDCESLIALAVPETVTDITALEDLNNLRHLTVGGENIDIRSIDFRKAKADKEKKEEKAELNNKAEVAEKRKKSERERARQKLAEEKLRDKRELEALAPEFSFTSNDLRETLVIVDCGNNGVGSGFIAEDNGQTYVYTNQHVVFGSKSFKLTTLSGKRLKPESFELSKSRDIIRFKVASAESLKFALNAPSIDSPVVVYGNSSGGGVSTQIYGKVNGLGPDKIEVSAKFVQGNSGSPILSKHMKVVGIASYATRPRTTNNDWVKQGTRFTDVRRFGYRFNDIEWIKPKWNSFVSCCKKIQKFGSDSDLIYEVAVKWANQPFDELDKDKKYPMGLKAWVSTNNHCLQRRDEFKEELEGRSGRRLNELANANKTISRDMLNNSKKLAALCAKVSRKGKTFLKRSKKQLTQFQIDELEKHIEFMEYMNKEIVKFGSKLAKVKALHYQTR